MPIIVHVKYDGDQLTTSQATALATATQEFMVEAIGIPEVYVYASTAQINVKVAPVLITVEMGWHREPFAEQYANEVKEKLAKWREQNGETYPIYLTITPIHMKAYVNF